MSDLRRDAKIVLGSVAATCIAFAVGMAWLAFKPSLPSVLGVAPPKFADAKTETVPCKTVQALAPNVKEEVGLPVAVQKDEQASVLTIAAVPRSDNPLFATAVLHRDSGIGEIYFTPQPLPWLAFNKQASVFAGYAIAGNESLKSTWRAGARYEFVQAKAINIHVEGGLFGDGYKFAEIGGRINF